MSVVGIDVGETTGWAILFEDGTVFEHGNETIDTLHNSRVFKLGEGFDICIEYPETIAWSAHGNRIEEVARAFLTRYPDAATVKPGTWKQSSVVIQPWPKGLKKPANELTQHEKDAINIARWYMQKRGPRGDE